MDRSQVNRDTSLSDLGADELDFVELIMELEEQFEVSLPDGAVEEIMGTRDWQAGMKNVTMAKLAAAVEEQKRRQ